MHMLYYGAGTLTPKLVVALLPSTNDAVKSITSPATGIASGSVVINPESSRASAWKREPFRSRFSSGICDKINVSANSVANDTRDETGGTGGGGSKLPAHTSHTRKGRHHANTPG
jgi:hypothetical protein